MGAILAAAEEHVLSLIRVALCALYLSCWVAPAYAAFEVGGGGAYTTSLGGAFSAGVESAEAVWFNPAAVARLRIPRLTSTHGVLFAALPESPTIHSGAVAWPGGWGTAQVGYSTLRADEWSESSLLLGVARSVHSRLSLGMQIRANGWRSGPYARGHWLANFGGLYEVGWLTPHIYMRTSFVLSNLSAAQASENGRPTGQRARSYTVGMQLVSTGRTLLLDVEGLDDEWQLRAGYEAQVRDGLMVRLGVRLYSGDTINRTWHTGLGYEWKKLHFDYAFSHSVDLNSFGAAHRFGIGCYWN